MHKFDTISDTNEKPEYETGMGWISIGPN